MNPMFSALSVGSAERHVGWTRRALLGILLCLPACNFHCNSGPGGGAAVGTAGHAPMAGMGPETWIIDGAPVRVDATYYLGLPVGLQYTIEHTIAAKPPDTEAEALVIAWPLISYAYRERKHLRTSISRNGVSLSADRIGVALVQRVGASRSGYRVALSTAQIEGRLRGSVPKGP